MAEVTQADREAAGNLADLICGCADREQHRRDVAAVMDYRADVLLSIPDNPAMVERVARALMIDDGIDPDVFKGMHGGFGHYADTAQAVLRAVGGGE